jgi:chemotaxis protein MotA
MLAAAADGYYQRVMVTVDILNSMASAAPASGMLGTLIGLIAMLQGLGGDASQLGAGLAVALITTLYGVLFARLLFMPAATQLRQKQGIQRFGNFLVTEGFALLADKQEPAFHPGQDEQLPRPGDPLFSGQEGGAGRR